MRLQQFSPGGVSIWCWTTAALLAIGALAISSANAQIVKFGNLIGS